MFCTACSTKVQCSTCTACFLFSLTALLPVEDVSGGARTHLGAAHVHFRDGMCCPRSVSGYHLSFFEMKMDDTQTWMILLRKRWIRPGGRPGKKSRQYFCTTCSNNYGQIYNVGQLGETWNARESGAAMAATATCTNSLFYGPRLPPLSGSRSSPKVFYPGQFSEQCLVWRFLFRS